jgi:iron complex transport system ATP-binding protein
MSLEAAGLAHRYRPRLPPVLSDCRFGPLRRGSLTVLVGPNGVGKTTLFRLIAGLIRPQAGRVALDGRDLSAASRSELRRLVYHLTQHTAHHAALCVFDQVLLALKTGGGWRASRDDLSAVEAAIREVGIEALSDRSVTELSGGQQQLVAIAQALVRRPQVLLLDEPTSALDLRRQLEIMQLLQRVTADRGMITIAALHDLNLAARYADTLLLLHDGAIAAAGKPIDVLASAALSQAYGVDVHVETTGRGSLVVDPHLAH